MAHSPTPRSLVAEATLYPADKAATLAPLGCITRLPGPLKRGWQVIRQALPWDTWHELDDTTRDQGLEWCHYGLAPRWVVVSSQAALERAEARSTKAQPREWQAIEPHLVHGQAQRFARPEAAHAALAALANSWRSHQVASGRVIDHTHSAGTGRPTSTSPITSSDWQIHAQARPDHERLASRQQQSAGVVIGTHLDASPVSEAAVLRAYKAHAQAEGGCRFRKDPWCLVSSLFVKKPGRIPGRLMVMT